MSNIINVFLENKNKEYSDKHTEEFHLFYQIENTQIQDFCISTEGGHNYAKLLDIDKILLLVLSQNIKELYVYHNHPEETFAPSIEDLGIASSLFAYLRLFDVDIKQQYILCGNSGIYNFNFDKENINVVYDDGIIRSEHNLLKDEFYKGAIDLYKETHKNLIQNIISASYEKKSALLKDFVKDFKIGLKKILSVNENINVDYFGSIVKEFSFIDNQKIMEHNISNMIVSDLNDVYKKDFLSDNMIEINKLENELNNNFDNTIDNATKKRNEYKKVRGSIKENQSQVIKKKDKTRS